MGIVFFLMLHNKSLNPEVNIASQLHENGWKSQENTVAASYSRFISKESCSLQILIISVAVVQFYYVVSV